MLRAARKGKVTDPVGMLIQLRDAGMWLDPKLNPNTQTILRSIKTLSSAFLDAMIDVRKPGRERPRLGHEIQANQPELGAGVPAVGARGNGAREGEFGLLADEVVGCAFMEYSGYQAFGVVHRGDRSVPRRVSQFRCKFSIHRTRFPRRLTIDSPRQGHH